jgi:hypothetical protein
MGPIQINKGCHVKCSGDINFVGVHGKLGSQIAEGSKEGAVFTRCAMLAFLTSSPVCIRARRA